MKRIDLTGSVYYEVIDKLCIRPSLKLKINHYLSQNGIKTVCALCDKSEDELLAIPRMSEEMVASIKDYLGTAGLRLGMTDEELFDYIDANFLEEQSKAAEEKKREEEKESRLRSLKILCVMLLLITPPAISLVYFVRQTFFLERPKVKTENVRSYESIRGNSDTIDYPMFDGELEAVE